MNDSASEEIGDCAAVTGQPVPKGIEARVGLLLVRLGSALGGIADERLAETGLGGRGYGILAILCDDGPDSQFELAQMLGKAPGVIVAAVDQLESAGLVERRRDPSDRRRTRVIPTAAGREALARADELAQQTLAQVFAGLNRDELGQLEALVRKGLAVPAGAPG